jgi:para-nitrobenzyl esterase
MMSELEHETLLTTSGPIRGVSGGGLRRYLGIPYAQAPVGDLRWKPPRPMGPWREPRDCSAYGPDCAQTETLFGFAAPSDSEDCLYLNVVAPDSRTGDLRPVMVWIHGGGLFCGSGRHYDPRALIERGNVVFVSINYRLNVFGFFAHPGLACHDYRGVNFGLMDQQAALRWVRANAATFGGDPARMTIFGESGGATSVQAHLVSPGSVGLFDRAIVQSSNAWNRAFFELDTASQVALEFERAAGATGLSGLMELPAGALLAANADAQGDSASEAVRQARSGLAFGGPYSIGLTTDGVTIPCSIRDAFETGNFNRVPILRGVNRDEFSFFVGLEELAGRPPLDAAGYEARIAATFGAEAETVLRHYPVSVFKTPSNALAAVLTDFSFIVGERTCARALARHVETFVYLLDVPDTPVPSPAVSFDYGTAHTADLPYIFPGFHGASGPAPVFDAAQAQLSNTMLELWSSFAASGRPQPADGEGPSAEWPPYAEPSEPVYRLASSDGGRVDGLFAQHQCELWESILARFAA